MANIGQSLRISLSLLTASVALAQAPLKQEPDLRGIWSYETVTPLERPLELGAKEFFTKAEAEIYEKQLAAANNKDRRDGTAQEDLARAYSEAWWERGTHVVSTLRTSLIVEPKDGRIPPLKPQAQAAAKVRAQIQAAPPRGPEDRGVGERCIANRLAGPPFVPGPYNNNVQIFQSPGQVVIFNEMIHDYRVVRTDGSPALPTQFRFWLGHSRGHWEGKTLVVDTTNFNEQVHFQGSDENLRVIERFTRIGPGEMLYEFRIEDPTAFERPWAGEIPLHATSAPIYEYACHEGNYSLVGLLAGARADEAAKLGTGK